MGFLDFFKKNCPPPEPPKPPAPLGPELCDRQERNEHGLHEPRMPIPEAITEITRIITAGDDAVLQEAAALADIQKYYAEHKGWFADLGLDDSIDPAQLQWLALIYILEEHNYVCERDWKDEKDDFVFFFSSLKGIKTYNLAIDPDWFNMEESIAEWCAVLKEKWSAQGCFAAVFDINSDSYVLFPCKADDFARLQPLGELLSGHFFIVDK